MDLTPPIPFTQAEAALARAEAASGKIPTLETCRRFIATIRTNITASPTKTAATKKTRVVKAVITEADFTAF